MRWTLTISFILAAWMLSASAEINLNGYIKLDERLGLENKGEITWNRATLGLKAKSEQSGQVSGYSELRFFTQVASLEVELREAYIDFFVFPFANTDLRIGKQRIAWGTADKLNPTDNLNPYDFTDLLDFGEKDGSIAIKSTTYINDNTLTLAYLPVFSSSIMPATYNSSLNSAVSAYLPTGFSLASLATTTTLPQNHVRQSMFGVKLDRNIKGLDMSFSYFSGWDSVPNLSNLSLQAVSATQMAGTLTLNYPRITVLGYDLAGSFSGIGFWAELANFNPENLTQTVALPTPLPTVTSTINNYTKYTLGFDYNFTNGIYLNSQFMHGFYDERGSNLTNLLFATAEKKFMDEKLAAKLVWAGDLDKTGYILGPQLSYTPYDATEIEVGVFSIDGQTGSKLSSMKTMDQLYMKVKYSF
ncbi:hypothetical protein ACFL52_02430 [Candidatus Margulisiibacteriota bacterium]